MFPEAGEKLGPYEILGELGGGGMARVYRAWDGRLHREVAIKVIDDRFAMPGIGERFLREARAASGLNHPNICTIFDIGEQDGAPYLVMELLEGETLRERINQGAITVEEILRYGAEVSDALAAAHARGIVHRDIKPANIFLVKKPNGSAQAKVLDFGLAKIEQYASEERDFASNLTSMGATVGTVSYMSPEQARGEKLDARSDLFSLGIVMYEMATGQLPFRGNTSALVFVQLLGQMAPEPIKKLNGQIPVDLEQVIMKLLAKSARARYQSATELMDELQELAEQRSGWLTRLKTPPLVEAARPEPLARPPYTSRVADAAKPKTPVESHPSDEMERALPARPGDPQGVRAPGRRRKDSAEHKSQQQKKVQARIESKGEGSSGQVPVAPEGTSVRPVRTSIATNPKMSFPATAPYAGQSGMHRAVGESGTTPAQSGDLTGAAPGLSGIRPVVRDPRPLGVRTARGLDGSPLLLDEAADSANKGVDWKWIALAIALIVLIVGFLAWKFGWLGGAAPMQGGVLLLTHLRNTTGDTSLDVALLQGLEIELMESRVIEVRGPVLYEAQYRKAGISGDASAERMREIAGRVGASRYLTGEIKGSDGAGATPFTISVDVMDVASGRRLSHVEETVENKSVMLGAVDKIAAEVRSAMGESEASIATASVPLRAEGSLSIDALYAYFQGQEALQQGRTAAAREFFEKAVGEDAHFALAQIQLAVIYRQQLSELKAAAAARAAAAVNDASDRVKLLAQFRRELDADGDLESGLKTIQSFIHLYPMDAHGPEGLAEVMRLEGRFAESLQAAEKAYALDPFDVEVYWQAEQSMLCANRFDSVGQIEAMKQSAGLLPGPDALLAYYLGVKGGELTPKLANARSSPEDLAVRSRYGFYLDDTGRLSDGEAVWRGVSQTAPSASAAAAAMVRETIESLNPSAANDSSKASFLAQGALNRALLGECKAALELTHEAISRPHGTVASFDAGVAGALCGDGQVAAASLAELERKLPGDTAAREYLVPDLKATLALKAGNASGALDDLRVTGTYDLVSLTPYLRGLTHEALNQPGLAIADFEMVLAHRGALAAMGSTVYPMAELQIARAYAGSGDNASSAAAYRTFAELWKNADPGERLLTDARARTH